MLKGIQQGLALPAGAMIPSFAALRDYGNTSCSTTWYVLAYTESCRDVRPGDVLLQVRPCLGPPAAALQRPRCCGGVPDRSPPAAAQCGMGGGMEAGVNIWRALRGNRCVHPTWRHLAGRPLTEADLPRGIEAITSDHPAKGEAPRRAQQAQGEGDESDLAAA